MSVLPYDSPGLEQVARRVRLGTTRMSSSISSTIAQSALKTRTYTSTIESARSSRERRVIPPGSPATRATSNRPSMSGSNHPWA
jgi:hypothetical protein